MAARKPTKLNAPATVTAIQLTRNGTSTPFKVRTSASQSGSTAKARSGQRWRRRACKRFLWSLPVSDGTRGRGSPPQPKWGGAGAAAAPFKQGSSLTEPFSMCRTIAVSRRRESGSLPPLAQMRSAAMSAVTVSGTSSPQSAGSVTAPEIYMRQSEPPRSRKSAVLEGVLGSLASSNAVQPIDRAD